VWKEGEEKKNAKNVYCIVFIIIGRRKEGVCSGCERRKGREGTSRV
jgi:hypothetical protein